MPDIAGVGDNKATAALAPTLKKLMTEKPLPHDVEVVVIDRTVFGWFSPWKIWIVDHGDVENARTLAHEWEHARQTAAGEKPSAENEANARRQRNEQVHKIHPKSVCLVHRSRTHLPGGDGGRYCVQKAR